ncbi:VTT domain-containing protein [Salinirubellus salinus]|uniref:VTT domain-containing protein n=1 Tax=Salinirubellus salinus TaxID=1364945 RepID=A0A9E7UB49_9EURY|nr:VTT domain-containing protein [Salinirubellus salinus]UWM54828.1 VTT domain-containing protein [Salinirubellus salinus]
MALAALGLFALFGWRYVGWLTDADAVRAAVDGYGLLTPVVYVLVTAAGIVVAPVPGPAVALAGGYLFGWLGGTVYTMVGVTIGSVAAFLLARRWGRAYVERAFTPDAVERFDDLVAAHGDTVLFLAFLVPGLPDDALCFLAGLTAIPLRRFVLLVVVARTPAHLLVAAAGAGLATGDLELAVGILAVLAVLGLLGYRYGGRMLGAGGTDRETAARR